MNVNSMNGSGIGVQVFRMERNPLRQHQMERQKSGSFMDDMLGGSRKAAKSAKGGTGMFGASMQAMIAADSSMHQVKLQGTVKSQMEGKAGVLASEIKIDEARGGDTTKKREVLEEVEARAQDITALQMETLNRIEKDLQEAAEADRGAKKNVEKKEKHEIDQPDQKPGEISADETVDTNTAAEPVRYEPVDAVSEGIMVSTGTNESAGNHVDVKV